MSASCTTAQGKAGDIALSRTGDPALGDFEDAVMIGRQGETPADIASFTGGQ
ncbi:MAG TPA: hypothetical protein VF511_02990 [Chthoniobacterales bacterium]